MMSRIHPDYIDSNRSYPNVGKTYKMENKVGVYPKK